MRRMYTKEELNKLTPGVAMHDGVYTMVSDKDAHRGIYLNVMKITDKVVACSIISNAELSDLTNGEKFSISKEDLGFGFDNNVSPVDLFFPVFDEDTQYIGDIEVVWDTTELTATFYQYVGAPTYPVYIGAQFIARLEDQFIY